jgi:hypothetical protein
VESSRKRWILEKKTKKRSKDWKAKQVKPHLKSSMFKKKRRKEDEIYKLLGEILSKERKKGDHIFL